jgi:hypothetical protein
VLSRFAVFNSLGWRGGVAAEVQTSIPMIKNLAEKMFFVAEDMHDSYGPGGCYLLRLSQEDLPSFVFSRVPPGAAIRNDA